MAKYFENAKFGTKKESNPTSVDQYLDICKHSLPNGCVSFKTRKCCPESEWVNFPFIRSLWISEGLSIFMKL